MESHKVKQHELIEQLKQQLEDLERYAYETGEAGLPQTLIVERQKIIIGECSLLLKLLHECAHNQSLGCVGYNICLSKY
jgi:hypothetical protein